MFFMSTDLMLGMLPQGLFSLLTIMASGDMGRSCGVGGAHRAFRGGGGEYRRPRGRIHRQFRRRK